MREKFETRQEFLYCLRSKDESETSAATRLSPGRGFGGQERRIRMRNRMLNWLFDLAERFGVDLDKGL